MKVDLNELKKYVLYREKLNSVPLEEIIWCYGDCPTEQPTREEIKDYKYVGLSNLYFAVDKYLNLGD